MRAVWWGGQDRARRTDEAIPIFEKQRPDLRIATESTAWGDYWTKVATLVAGGNAPDVLQMDYRYLVECAKRGTVLPLDAYVPKPLAIQDFGADNLDSCRVDGKLYGVNLGINSTATFLDTAAFAKAGVPPPTYAWTWDDLRRVSAEITKSRGKGFWGCMDSGGGEPAFEVFACQNGKDLYTADGKLGVDVELTTAWLDCWQSMRRVNDCVPPDVQALDKGSTDSAMLVLGKAAVDLRHSNFLEGFQLAHKEKLAITMYPQTKGGKWGQYIKPSQMILEDPAAAVHARARHGRHLLVHVVLRRLRPARLLERRASLHGAARAAHVLRRHRAQRLGTAVRDVHPVARSAVRHLPVLPAVPDPGHRDVGAQALMTIRFGVAGTNHRHIHGQVGCLVGAGAAFVSFHEPDPALAEEFAKRYPNVRRARCEAEVLEDASIRLLVTAAIPAERAALAVRAMRHGKDVMTDKPGVTTFAQLADVRNAQQETGRIFSVCFSERFETRSTVKAWELVRAGAIGRVVHTNGLGPHRINRPTRPAWFFEKERYGGILADIASHQADQFLLFTGSTRAQVVAAHVANYANADKPELEDFGEVLWRGDGGTGYVRVDWYTPDGLPTWGDGRLTILGTEGYIELRKYVDIAGRPGIDHLFLVDGRGTHYVDCSKVPLTYGPALVHDVLHRTESAMPQAHCFLACELALAAEARAIPLTAPR